MEGVAQCKVTRITFQITFSDYSITALDPGNALFCDWFKSNQSGDHNLVVDVGGGNGHVSKFLAEVWKSNQVL